MAFDDLSDDELAAEQRRIHNGALETAQLAAAQRLTVELGNLMTAQSVLDTLALDDADLPHYDLLKAFEKRWALLVLRLLAGIVADPAVAVSDARERGATVPEIAETLGLTTQAVYTRYRTQVVGRGRRQSTKRRQMARPPAEEDN